MKKNQDVTQAVNDLRRQFNDQLSVADLMDLVEKQFLTTGRALPEVIVKKSIAASFRLHPQGSFVASGVCSEEYWLSKCQGRWSRWCNALVKNWPPALLIGVLLLLVGMPLLRLVVRGLSMGVRAIL